jgi:RNA polymerase sigma-70 factor, ECF subfamily
MLQSQSDVELMQRIVKGDERAFELLFKAYYARLVAFAQRYLCDVDSSENVVQSVFVKLWDKRETLQIASPYSYLVVSVKNASINELNRKKHFQEVDVSHLRIIDEKDEMPDDEIIKQVQDVISQLPEQRQRIFKMNRFDGLKYREIAIILGLSVKTVEAQMGKALKFLRENLKGVNRGF